jgi:hypothetical protein
MLWVLIKTSRDYIALMEMHDPPQALEGDNHHHDERVDQFGHASVLAPMGALHIDPLLVCTVDPAVRSTAAREQKDVNTVIADALNKLRTA